MANGDAAAAAGMDTVAGTADLRNAYDEENKCRDYLAAHMTSGTHPASAITSGVLALARIPVMDDAHIDEVSGSKIVGPLTDVTGLSYISSLTVAGTLTANTVILGNVTVTGVLANATAYGSVVTSGRTLAVRSDGSFGYFPSARRYKKNITPAKLDPELGLKLADLLVEFDWRKEYGDGHEYGLIAEDVAEVAPWLTYDGDEDGQVDGVAYERLVLPLLATVKALTARVTELEKERL